MWDLIACQKEVIDQLKMAIKNNELSHAYLFLGSEGVGKQATAKVFASVVNCPKGGCGECPICLKIQHDLHPDVVFVEPEGNFFTIEQVRELQHEVDLKPFEAQMKVYILDDVDKMTAEAANALLKTLEEPPLNVLFILLTPNLDGILPTVVSRCQIVRFKPISVSSLISFLVSKYKVKEVDAELFARLSGGILTKAIRFAESELEHRRRKLILQIIEGVPLSDGIELAEVAEKIIEEVKKPLEELKTEQKKEFEEAKEIAVCSAHASRIKNVLSKKHKRRLNREESQGYNEVLSIFSSWYRDLMVLKETSNKKLLTNIDCVDLLEKQSEQISSSQAWGAIEIIKETKWRLKLNVNPQLAFEAMLFELKSLTQIA
jgi:DNA polymerase-3 subunit delta'